MAVTVAGMTTIFNRGLLANARSAIKRIGILFLKIYLAGKLLLVAIKQSSIINAPFFHFFSFSHIPLPVNASSPIELTETGITIFCRFLQSRKVSWSIRVIQEGSSTRWIVLLPWKAPAAMRRVPSGTKKRGLIVLSVAIRIESIHRQPSFQFSLLSMIPVPSKAER